LPRRIRLPRRARLAALAVLVLAALAGFTGVARSAIQEGGLTRQQQLAQERSEHRAALQGEREAARQVQREARTQREEQREEEKKKRKERDTGDGGHVYVETACKTVTANFSKFPEAGTRTLRESVTIMRNHGKDKKPIIPPPFTFSGSDAKQVIALPVFEGKYIVDLQASWKGSHIDVGAIVNCGPTPQYAIEKEQRLGEVGEYTKAEPTGHVGETVDYAIIVRNTGNVPLTFSELSDPRCDPGTILGGPGSTPVPVGGSAKFTCTHRLTEADLTIGSYSNVASIVATPPEGDGGPIPQPSETVVVKVAPPSPGPGPNPPPSPSPGSNNTGNAVAGTQVAGGGGGGAATGPNTGVLAFVQATPPALLGAQGCVRNTFKASLRAKGVATVTFYLDGHKLRTVSARSARRGTITISLNISRLKVGAHRLMAKITMARTASSGKQVRASRSLTFVHCASAAVRPKFTG
jgi:hypothetical protein